jgi:peptidoglycan/LPS O-acetylase OafA/YrhL
MLVLVAVFVAARALDHAPPTVDWRSGATLAAASLLTVIGAAGLRNHLPTDMPSSTATVAAAAPTAVFLLALMYVASWSRSAASAAPAITVAGLTAAVVYLLELIAQADQDVPERGSVTLMLIGLAIVAGVGVWLWLGASGLRRGSWAVAMGSRTDRAGARRR